MQFQRCHAQQENIPVPGFASDTLPTPADFSLGLFVGAVAVFPRQSEGQEQSGVVEEVDCEVVDAICYGKIDRIALAKMELAQIMS
ncbi:hypothetical protein GCM10007207_28580 [Asaia siamensis]|uniref:Uncharacterized protein n=1 Tax=Asaia siamensis TaxID=110479 RepID=A0ABQ1MJQ7_9PROT|nr:hypothetical protein AA0323_0537 [Asaia siamensis NRIC 0323]GGC41539.1 hypothetical protein GCM10007207_28580 [Asaia siamensis]